MAWVYRTSHRGAEFYRIFSEFFLEVAEKRDHYIDCRGGDME